MSYPSEGSRRDRDGRPYARVSGYRNNHFNQYHNNYDHTDMYDQPIHRSRSNWNDNRNRRGDGCAAVHFNRHSQERNHCGSNDSTRYRTLRTNDNARSSPRPSTSRAEDQPSLIESSSNVIPEPNVDTPVEISQLLAFLPNFATHISSMHTLTDTQKMCIRNLFTIMVGDEVPQDLVEERERMMAKVEVKTVGTQTLVTHLRQWPRKDCINCNDTLHTTKCCPKKITKVFCEYCQVEGASTENCPWAHTQEERRAKDLCLNCATPNDLKNPSCKECGKRHLKRLN